MTTKMPMGNLLHIRWCLPLCFEGQVCKVVNVDRCADCGLLCKSKAQLADHGSDHHGKENRKRRFSSAGSGSSPTKRKQTLREHRCGLCEKIMWSAAHLRYENEAR